MLVTIPLSILLVAFTQADAIPIMSDTTVAIIHSQTIDHATASAGSFLKSSILSLSYQSLFFIRLLSLFIPMNNTVQLDGVIWFNICHTVIR